MHPFTKAWFTVQVQIGCILGLNSVGVKQGCQADKEVHIGGS